MFREHECIMAYHNFDPVITENVQVRHHVLHHIEMCVVGRVPLEHRPDNSATDTHGNYYKCKRDNKNNTREQYMLSLCSRISLGKQGREK